MDLMRLRADLKHAGSDLELSYHLRWGLTSVPEAADL